MYQFSAITLFPEMFNALNTSITGKALQSGLISLHTWNPRHYTHDRHRRVDDRPYGGGPGMVMKAQPVHDAIQSARFFHGPTTNVVHLTPEGQPLSQSVLNQLAKQEDLILLCGRYEGIDERVIARDVDVQYSLGDFVLTGGELPAMVMIDGIARLLPGALGDEQSPMQDSFQAGLLDHPHYTRPNTYDGLDVPDILLSGNHQSIEQWRHKQALARTWQKRPDLLETRQLSETEQRWLNELKQRGHTDD